MSERPFIILHFGNPIGRGHDLFAGLRALIAEKPDVVLVDASKPLKVEGSVELTVTDMKALDDMFEAIEGRRFYPVPVFSEPFDGRRRMGKGERRRLKKQRGW